MLASKSWLNGATIGLNGGLERPIISMVVTKTTKLGLGASVNTKSRLRRTEQLVVLCYVPWTLGYNSVLGDLPFVSIVTI